MPNPIRAIAGFIQEVHADRRRAAIWRSIHTCADHGLDSPTGQRAMTWLKKRPREPVLVAYDEILRTYRGIIDDYVKAPGAFYRGIPTPEAANQLKEDLRRCRDVLVGVEAAFSVYQQPA